MIAIDFRSFARAAYDSRARFARGPGLLAIVILAIVILAFGGGCAMIFWRPAAPLHTASYYSEATSGPRNEVFVAVRTRYSEKRSLDPLAGTTRKRDYRSEAALLNIAAGDNRVAWPSRPWFEFAGWIIEHSAYRGPGPGDSLWWIGGENDDYAGRERGLFFADASGRIHKASLLAGATAYESRYLLKAAVPSPSGRLMAIFEEDLVDANSRSSPDRLRIAAINMRSESGAVGAAPTTASGELSIALRTLVRRDAPGLLMSGPRWATDDSGFYFQTEAGVWFLAVDEETPRRADRYPACLSPGTKSGGLFSPRGRRLYFDDTAGEFSVVQESSNDFYSFADTPWRRADADGSQSLDCGS